MVDRQVGLVGVDMGSVYCPLDLVTLTRAHTLLLQANIVIVEGLTSLGKIKKSAVQFMALPLPIFEGDGAPVRALAIERE
jgi:kynurenine formamidase